MDCRERNIRELIVDFIDGTLDAPTAERVKRHLGDCPDCRKLEQDYRRTVEGIRGVFQESSLKHVSNETLVEFVDHKEGLDAGETESIELHLAVCPQCERKVEMLRQVGVEKAPINERRPRNRLSDFSHSLIQIFARRPAAGFSMAAILILAFAVIYWSVTGIDRGPQIQFTSARNITWLNESIRSDQPLPDILEKNNSIRVGVKFLAFFDEEQYSIQLQSDDGTVLHDLPVSRTDYVGIGVGLVIKSSSLPSGKYRLMLVSRKPADDSYSLQVAYPFVLVRDRK